MDIEDSDSEESVVQKSIQNKYWVRHLTFFFSTSAYFVNGNT